MTKRFLKKVLKHFGIVAFKHSSRIHVSEDESYRIIANLIGFSNPVIIDGGAHLGGAAEAFAVLLPDATIHCFEPDPTLGRQIAAKFAGNPRVHVVQVALGNTPGKTKFNINASRPTNSLLLASDVLEPGLKVLCQFVDQIEVDVTTIDDYCRSQGLPRLDILKLDLQGFDLFALQGAENTLKQVKVVLVEILFAEIYQGCGRFPDILDLMEKAGFVLYTLCGLQYGENSRLLWADAIFVRQGKTRASDD
jgi:FkbM family methyltransferase